MSDRQQKHSMVDIGQVWDALGELRSSPVVADARAYANTQHAEVERRRHFWARLFKIGSIGVATAAACFALLIVAGQISFFRSMVLTTEVGEIREEKLADGSSVILDTDTRVVVDLTSSERKLTLSSGQAHFDVAHDPERPFIVSFGRGSVTAIGTSFDVTAFPDMNSITLLSGEVEVTANLQTAKLKLQPGQQVTVTKEGKFTSPISVNLASISAWQKGQIDLTDLRLDEALARINRYSPKKIVVNDKTFSDRRISGIFQAGDTRAVVDALCAYFDLQVIGSSSHEIVLGRKGGF